MTSVLVDKVRSPGDGVNELLPRTHALARVLLDKGELFLAHAPRRDAAMIGDDIQVRRLDPMIACATTNNCCGRGGCEEGLNG